MHDVVNFLRNTVMDNPPIGSPLGHYMHKNGQFYTDGKTISAGIKSPINILTDFVLDPKILDRGVAHLEPPLQITFNGKVILLKSPNKVSFRINIGDGFQNLPDPPKFSGPWDKVPSGFVEALAKAVKFIGDKGFTQGVRLSTNKVTAIEPSHGVDIDVPGLVIQDPILLTEDVVNFLVSAQSLEEMRAAKTSITFNWSDGKWANARLLDSSFPDRVDQMFTEKAKSAFAPITQEMRDAFAHAAALGDGQVELYPEGWSSGKGAGKVDAECVTGLPQEHKSRWSVRGLSPVLEIAEEWAPGDYPAPCRYRAKNIKGMVLGVE